jgi:hypothetical protein
MVMSWPLTLLVILPTTHNLPRSTLEVEVDTQVTIITLLISIPVTDTVCQHTIIQATINLLPSIPKISTMTMMTREKMKWAAVDTIASKMSILAGSAIISTQLPTAQECNLRRLD